MEKNLEKKEEKEEQLNVFKNTDEVAKFFIKELSFIKKEICDDDQFLMAADNTIDFFSKEISVLQKKYEKMEEGVCEEEEKKLLGRLFVSAMNLKSEEDIGQLKEIIKKFAQDEYQRKKKVLENEEKIMGKKQSFYNLFKERGIVSSKNEIDDLYQDHCFASFMNNVNEKNLRLVLENFYKNINIGQLRELSRNLDVACALSSKEEIFRWVLDFCDVRDEDKFESVCKEEGMAECVFRKDVIKDEDLEKIKSGDLRDVSLKKKIFPVFKFHPRCKDIFNDLFSKIENAPQDINENLRASDITARLISSSLLFDYYSLQKAREKGYPKEILDKLKEKQPEIYEKAIKGNLKPEDIFLSREDVEKLVTGKNLKQLKDLENFGLLLEFDYYGILGQTLEDLEKNMEQKTREYLTEKYKKCPERIYKPSEHSLFDIVCIREGDILCNTKNCERCQYGVKINNVNL